MKMDFEMPQLRFEEIVALKLRALFEKKQYQLFRMSSFEEYDLYFQNKPFLKSDDIITFNSADGRLMALKPDITLSIVKSIQQNETKRVYYNEKVFRKSRQTNDYREINQMGLEYLGTTTLVDEAEVITLAAQSLSVVGQGALDISHMGFIEAMLSVFSEKSLPAALHALQTKSPHLMRSIGAKENLSEQQIDTLTKLTEISGSFQESLPKAKKLAQNNAEALEILEQIEILATLIECPQNITLRLDFSIINSADYYNGIIFQGFLPLASKAVLEGGRYDNLMKRFDKEQKAVGFAFYLDEIVSPNTTQIDEQNETDDKSGFLNIALPKGRLGDTVYALFDSLGYSCEELLQTSRKLIFEDNEKKIRYFLVKPSDVDIYVEHGAADIGIVGKDVLLESNADVLELADMELGKCKLAVAAKKNFKEDPALPLRVATKYPKVTRAYYATQSRAVEIIKLHGSIELAPLLDLSDVIVDIVESGKTLEENNLKVFADVAYSSARLIANHSAWRFKKSQIQTLLQKLEEKA